MINGQFIIDFSHVLTNRNIMKRGSLSSLNLSKKIEIWPKIWKEETFQLLPIHMYWHKITLFFKPNTQFILHRYPLSVVIWRVEASPQNPYFVPKGSKNTYPDPLTLHIRRKKLYIQHEEESRNTMIWFCLNTYENEQVENYLRFFTSNFEFVRNIPSK